jgi:hypothetical protein
MDLVGQVQPVRMVWWKQGHIWPSDGSAGWVGMPACRIIRADDFNQVQQIRSSALLPLGTEISRL